MDGCCAQFTTLRLPRRPMPNGKWWSSCGLDLKLGGWVGYVFYRLLAELGESNRWRVFGDSSQASHLIIANPSRTGQMGLTFAAADLSAVTSSQTRRSKGPELCCIRKCQSYKKPRIIAFYIDLLAKFVLWLFATLAPLRWGLIQQTTMDSCRSEGVRDTFSVNTRNLERCIETDRSLDIWHMQTSFFCYL